MIGRRSSRILYQYLPEPSRALTSASMKQWRSRFQLTPVDQYSFVLLDEYLRDCVEELRASGDQLSARSIVLLDDCACTITRHFRLLGGEGQSYFGQFRRLARRILHDVHVEQAYRQATGDLREYRRIG